MQFFILLLFALPFALGLYLLLAAAFHVPTYRATKVLLGAVRKNRKAAKNSDAILEELAAKLAGALPKALTDGAGWKRPCGRRNFR